jgi:hypothetical protein
MLVSRVPFCCPVCKSSFTEGKSIEAIEINKIQFAEQECSCTECSTEWIDRYRLITTEITSEVDQRTA